MFSFTGNSHSRGLQHGSQLAQAIRERVQTSLPAEMDAKRRARLAQPWIDASEELDVGLVREMSGIATGSGTSLVDIGLLNSFEAFDMAKMVERGGCTAIAVREGSRAVLAQNWDSNALIAAGLSVHLHRDADQPDVAVLASPGGLGWIGMNEAGLGLVTNDLLGGATASTPPSQVIRRFALSRSTTASALQALRTIGHPALRSYILADASGAIAGLEVLPHKPPALTEVPETGLAHANHAVTAQAAAVEDRTLQQQLYPSSQHRAWRAERLLRSTSGQTGPVERARTILSDHDGLPLSVCRHESSAEPTLTAASVIFDCAVRRGDFFLGLACTPRARETVGFPSRGL